MGRILCVITGFTSITNSTSELLNRLEDLGHEVGFATYGDYEKKNRKSRFTYYALAKFRAYELNAISLEELPYNSKRRINRQLYAKKIRSLLHELLMEDLNVYENVLDSFKPDLVFIDVEMPQYMAFTHQKKINLYNLSAFYTARCSTKFPPIHSDFVPNDSVSSKLKCSKLWASKIVDWRGRKVLNQARGFYTDHKSIVYNYIKPIVASSAADIKQDFFLWYAYHYKGFETVHTTYAELDWPSAQFKNHHYLGGLVNKEREITNGYKTIDSLQEILNVKKNKDVKLICLSFSSMKLSKKKSNQKLVRRIAKSISQNPNWIGVIGGRNEWTESGANPYTNVFCFEWIPLLHVLKYTDCLISHGGTGTMHECIEYNVPMLLYSFKVNDLNGNVARMQFHNQAVVGNASSDNVVDIGENITRAMNDSTIHANMQVLRSKETKEKYLATLETLVNNKLAKPI